MLQLTPTTSSQVLVVGLGRGGSGKSTGLAELAWRAMAHDRAVIIADGDMRSNTLSLLFPGALRPQSEEVEDVKSFISCALDKMLATGASAVMDFGGGDRNLIDYSRDLDVLEMCRDAGINPLAANFLGPDEEDLSHIVTLWESRVFCPQHQLLLFNEGAIRAGKTVEGAFKRTESSPEVARMVAEGMQPMFIRRLALMDTIKRQGGNLHAIAIRPATTTADHTVRQWVNHLERERAEIGVAGWLP